jgi:hypothetical protein
MSKKLIVVIVCAGMSFGLLLGGTSIGKNNTDRVMAAHYPPDNAITCSIEPCSLDDIIFDKVFSSSANGLCDNKEYTELKSELENLKAELATLEKDSQQYNDIIDKIHITWGRISVVLGELNSRIDIETESLFEISQHRTAKQFTDGEMYGIMNYTEDLFE